MESFIYDAGGYPFHAIGTRIYREADGTLIYDCPHCGKHPVPSHKKRERVEKYTGSAEALRIVGLKRLSV